VPPAIGRTSGSSGSSKASASLRAAGSTSSNGVIVALAVSHVDGGEWYLPADQVGRLLRDHDDRRDQLQVLAALGRLIPDLAPIADPSRFGRDAFAQEAIRLRVSLRQPVRAGNNFRSAALPFVSPQTRRHRVIVAGNRCQAIRAS
jgi:hypothetical protein